VKNGVAFADSLGDQLV